MPRRRNPSRKSSRPPDAALPPAPGRPPLMLLKGLLAVALFCPLIIGRRLWLHNPWFGPIPLVPGLERLLPAPLDWAVWGLLVGALPAIVLVRRPQRLLVAWCALFVGRAIGDRITWQPYYFQYLLMLAPLAFARWDATADADRDAARNGAVLAVPRLVLVAVYFWAGVSKLDHVFLTQGAGAIFAPIAGWFPVALLQRFSWLIPGSEIAIALLLLSRRGRNLGVYLAVATHALILLTTGPLGADTQPWIWSWNVCNALLVWMLFHGQRGFSAGACLWPRDLVVHRLALVLLTVAPLLSYVDLWDDYLGFHVYSYDTYRGLLYVTPEVKAALPESAQAAFYPHRTGPFVGWVEIQLWTQAEIQAALPPSEQAFRQVARRACERLQPAAGLALVLIPPPNRFTGAETRRVERCPALLAAP